MTNKDIKKNYPKEQIKKWQGVKNSDTGIVEQGYLWFYTNQDKTKSIGLPVKASNRSEAIKNYYSKPKLK